MTPSKLPAGLGSTALLTPTVVGQAAQVGTTRKFRKMLLPEMQIRAAGRTHKFDRGYLAGVAKAAREGAFPYIPLQVNDQHSKDPRFTEGTVSNLLYMPDGPDGPGLYGDVEFADDSGVALVRKSGGKVGVSVSMVEDLTRHEDGQDLRWPAALQHVLLTTDPHVRKTGGGWHPINLQAGDVGQLIDLSNTTFEVIEEEDMTAPTDERTEQEQNPDLVTMQVTAAQRDRLLGLLDDIETAQTVAGRGSGDEGGSDGGDRPDDSPTGPPTQLDRAPEDSDAIELMRSEIEVERSARVELARELQLERAQAEIVELQRSGLAPAIIEAARPLLEVERGTGTIELSRDGGRTQQVDPTRVVRDVLFQVIELTRQGLGVIDLDREIGMHVGSRSEQAERAARLKVWDEQFPEG